MTIFEKRDAYRKRIEKLYAELPEIEKRFFDETELAQAALRGGETQEFFEHSRNAATADKQRKEIESLPANGSGVSADEVEKAWNEYKSKNRHEKALKRLFDARKAYMDAIVEFKQVTGNEKKLVSEFREIAGVSGCRAEVIREMKPPRGVRWDLIEKCCVRGQFVNGIWKTEKCDVSGPHELEY